MTRPLAIVAAGLLAGGALVFAGRDARADWPMSRYDAQRTAAAKGKSNLLSPKPTWRFPMGGALYFTQHLIGDADGDLLPELYFVRGSGVVGKRLDDTQLWRTPAMGAMAIQALADLDGDEKPELVIAVGTNQAAVLDALTGEVRWMLPSTALYVASAILVGDLDGDGASEVLVQDCGCCGGAGDVPGAVYSFAGNLSSPKVLWNLPYASCGGTTLTTLLDADGDGKREVLLGRPDGFDLLDGATGQLRASLQYGDYLQVAQCVPAKLGGAGEQAVCVFAHGTTDDSGHRAFALRFEAAPAPELTVLWDVKIGVADYKIAMQPGIVSDLDGDGQMEVVVPAATGDNVWSTFVLDGLTGAKLATIDGKKASGTVPVISGGRGLIIADEPDGFSAHRFTRTPAPAVTQAFALTEQGLMSYRDFSLSTRAFPKLGLVAIDLTGDGTPDLITHANDGTMRVHDTSAGAGTPQVVAVSPVFDGVARIFAAHTTVNGTPALVTEWSDGFFRTHQISAGSLSAVSPPGVLFGGAYTTSWWRSLFLGPVIASLGPGQPDRVVVTDASAAMHVLDTSKADASTPPVELWSAPRTSYPVIVPGLAGGLPAVVAVQSQPGTPKPPKQQVVAFGPDGTVLWDAPFDGTAAADLVSGRIDGDGVDDLVLQWLANDDAGVTVRTTMLSGATGAKILDGKTYPNELATGASLWDHDGDGRADVFHQGSGLRVISGATGAEISPPPVESAQCAMPMLVDVDGDLQPEVVLQAGHAAVTVLSSNLESVLWKSSDGQSTIQYGALARCPGGARLVESTYFYHTARLTLTDLSIPKLGAETVMILAGGKSFPDEASATAAGVFQGTLTAVSVHENLTGFGRPTAVVGSSDGWLYGLDPCAGTLDFTYEFGDAVGSVAFGDTDGDGLDEMVVSVSDGFIYGMKQVEPTGGTGGMSTGGTGGSGNTGGAVITGGGGAGGASGGASPTAPEQFLLYGRACTCEAPGHGREAPLGASLASLGALLALARRRRR